MNYQPEDGFPYYFDLARDRDCRSLFASLTTFTFLNLFDEEAASFRYATGKWSIKQIVGHITDHERIKMFRAFLLSRTEPVQLWGYDQNFLVDHSRFEALSMRELIADLSNVRKASISFIDSLSEDQLQFKGWAGQHHITLEDFLKSIIGHEMHHLNIIRERYPKPWARE